MDAETGEPIIDLRAMQAAGKLHLVKKVTETGGVEIYSSQEAAAILGRFLGMEKRRPEEGELASGGRADVRVGRAGER